MILSPFSLVLVGWLLALFLVRCRCWEMADWIVLSLLYGIFGGFYLYPRKLILWFPTFFPSPLIRHCWIGKSPLIFRSFTESHRSLQTSSRFIRLPSRLYIPLLIRSNLKQANGEVSCRMHARGSMSVSSAHADRPGQLKPRMVPSRSRRSLKEARHDHSHIHPSAGGPVPYP